MKAVLLPGGGVLHTYAVREALALGLKPIVTDRDPNCPCARMDGVDFHQINCYDTDAHLRLAEERKADLVGAFCAGADTHVQVAYVALLIGSRWVSPATAWTCRDKIALKRALLRAGVPTAKIDGVGPFVSKPSFGSGSRGVFFSEGFFGIKDGRLYEERLYGPEQSVEIFLEDGREPVWVNIVDRHFAVVDGQPFEWGHTNPTQLPLDTRRDIFELAEKTARAVGATCGFFKCDTILTADGPKVLECCPRLSGGFDSQISTPLASGRNLIRYGLQFACGLERDIDPLEFPDWDRKKVTIIHRPELASAECKK